VRGVVARGKGAPVGVETILVPDPGPGEAVVDVQACWVCHTDLHYREGNSKGTDAVEAIKGHTHGFGVDVAIDAVGHPAVFTQAFYARDLAGRVVLVGVPTPDMTISLPLIEVFGRGGAIKSSWYGDCLPSRDFPLLADLSRQGRFPLADFVTEAVGLDDVEEAFDNLRRGEVLRSVVVLDK
jgi:S-(hydroxymethyl)mycothiol dehydrogenase